MRIYAVYRPLYGEDFIEDSILSILDYVDKVFFCYADTPLGDVREVDYMGSRIHFPLRPGKTFDQALEKVEALNSPKIECLLQDGRTNMGQFTRLMNDLILPNWERPDMAFLIEPDHVLKRSEIERAIEQFAHAQTPCATTQQTELWKLPDWSIPARPHRVSTVFWNTRVVDTIPDTRMQADPLDRIIPRLDATTHNFGFCVSYRAMFWKHLLSMAFSPKIGDSVPDPDWFVEKWLKWDPLHNNSNLEIALNYSHFIPKASPYPRDSLPERIRTKYGYDQIT